MTSVTCPICSNCVLERDINNHLDSGCSEHKFLNSPSGRHLHPHTQGELTSKLAPIFSQREGSKPSDISTLPSKTAEEFALAPSKKRKIDISSPSQASSSNPKRSNGLASAVTASAPLAERLRPRSLCEFVGQKHLTGPGSLLMNMLESGNLGSIIFWGPPGSGKTTLSRLLAMEANCTFKELSATSAGINDVRSVFEEAKGCLVMTGRRTVIFLDEIHRFNKSQQDVFLPYIEKGLIQMIGATTENPSFKLTGALISRCRVFVLERLTDEDVRDIVSGAMERVSHMDSETQGTSSAVKQTAGPRDSVRDSMYQAGESGSGEHLYPSYPQLTNRIILSIISLSAGDARTALSLLELVLASKKDIEGEKLRASLAQSVSSSYDRTGESHYDMISALHKCVRGSQGSAAMYWLARMLTAGEDPMYISRRMVVCASEDIGLADNHALPLAVATLHACQQIGMPECRINLAHLVAYLSEAPKSTRAYEAYGRAEQAAKLDPTAPVPVGLRNAPTMLMKELGYSKGYRYNPSYAHPVHNDYSPLSLRGDKFLKDAEDMSDKVWDEDALLQWERECNGGRPWSGRPASSQ
ncbi:P-loop containing nucleoside triphosphate hydrolase protein [Paxillus ammoniavirescens]|nr:P-loop containing nucleoside triphosphate hydrolase protein [Paxillus ammoniavirescens]